ncbi:MAG: CRISPR-associated endonuclease Cas3'', partial [Verrucomicrobiaceae bacterium]
LLDAPKRIERAKGGGGNIKLLATEIVTASEQCEGLTLAVVNTVKTARKLHEEVVKLTRKAAVKPVLLHSRFRPEDRAKRLCEVMKSEGTRGIVISTQVIEAGVDLSASTLFTELAPWSSLVQRFGRCNRRGDVPDAKVYWFEPSNPAPYSGEQLTAARERLENSAFTDVSPNQVRSVPIPAVDRPATSHILRRKDLVELFDTTPDLAGNDLDIDRWVREVEESGVQVFWREWDGWKAGSAPMENRCQPSRAELCSVPIGEFKDFVKKTGTPVWFWDFLDGKWVRVMKVEQIYPGQNYLLPGEAGGYLPETGWTPDSKACVPPAPSSTETKALEETEDDYQSQRSRWQSIAQHTDDVCSELEALLVVVSEVAASNLRHAARWHDWGKAHEAFQAKLKPETAREREATIGSEPAAKAPKTAWRSAKLPAKPQPSEVRRKYFRHELASALGVLHPETPLLAQGMDRDLVAYLIAAHHGKVRLSIRSLPGEWPAPNGIRFARGVWEGYN